MRKYFLTLLVTGIFLGTLFGTASAYTVRVANINQWEMDRHLDRGNFFSERDDRYVGLDEALDRGVRTGIVWWWDKKSINNASLIPARYATPKAQVARAFVGSQETLVALAESKGVVGLSPQLQPIQELTLPQGPQGWAKITMADGDGVIQIENQSLGLGGSWQVASIAVQNPQGVLERIPLRTAPGSNAYLINKLDFQTIFESGRGKQWVREHLQSIYGISLIVVRSSSRSDMFKSMVKNVESLEPDIVLVHLDASTMQNGETPPIVIGWEIKPFIPGVQGETNNR